MVAKGKYGLAYLWSLSLVYSDDPDFPLQPPPTCTGERVGVEDKRYSTVAPVGGPTSHSTIADLPTRAIGQIVRVRFTPSTTMVTVKCELPWIRVSSSPCPGPTGPASSSSPPQTQDLRAHAPAERSSDDPSMTNPGSERKLPRGPSHDTEGEGHRGRTRTRGVVSGEEHSPSPDPGRIRTQVPRSSGPPRRVATSPMRRSERPTHLGRELIVCTRPRGVLKSSYGNQPPLPQKRNQEKHETRRCL